MRVPPKVVQQHDDACGSATISPIARRVGAERMRPQRGERGVGLVRGDDRDELALVGDVQRVDAEQVARADHRGRDGQQRLVEHDAEVGVAGELVADRADAAAGRVAHPAGRRRGVEQRLDELAERRGVGADVGLEREVAAGQHHGHAVVGDGARHAARRRRAAPAPAPSVASRRDRCRRRRS